MPGSRGWPWGVIHCVFTPSGKSQSYRFPGNTGPDSLENHKATSQCWAIIGLPAKQHFNGVTLEG